MTFSELPLSNWKNPHRLIIGKMLDFLVPSFLDGSSSVLQVTSLDEFQILEDSITDFGIS